MTLSLYDRVIETTQTGGTGPVTLLGTIPGYQPFTVVGNGNSCYFYIYECGDTGAASGAWEVCFGTYNSATPSLSRTTVISSSNNGNPVNFPAGTTKRVVLSMPAVKAVYADSNNNVGIGTSSPNAKLEVLSTSGAPQLRLSYNDIDTFSDFTVSADGYLYITSPSGGGLILTGNLFFDGDGNWDIGSDSLNRPNDIYFTGSLLGGPLANIQIGDLGYMKFGRFVTHLTSNGIIGNLCMMNANHDNFGLLQFGGTTSSFPALKKSTTTGSVALEAKLADDSDYGHFRAKELRVYLDSTYDAYLRTAGGQSLQIGYVDRATNTYSAYAGINASAGGVTNFISAYLQLGLNFGGTSSLGMLWAKGKDQLFIIDQLNTDTNISAVMAGLDHRTTGTPAAGFGATYQFQLQSSTTVARNAVDITAAWATATDANRLSRATISTYTGSTAAEGLRLENLSTGESVAAFGGAVSSAYRARFYSTANIGGIYVDGNADSTIGFNTTNGSTGHSTSLSPGIISLVAAADGFAKFSVGTSGSALYMWFDGLGTFSWANGASSRDTYLGRASGATARLIAGVNASEVLRIEDSKIGFYGVNAVARQLLATGAGHTVDDVITALQTLGLLRQS